MGECLMQVEGSQNLDNLLDLEGFSDDLFSVRETSSGLDMPSSSYSQMLSGPGMMPMLPTTDILGETGLGAHESGGRQATGGPSTSAATHNDV